MMNMPIQLSQLTTTARVASTKKREQSAAFGLDAHLAVVRWAENDHLGFRVPYLRAGLPHNHAPTSSSHSTSD